MFVKHTMIKGQTFASCLCKDSFRWKLCHCTKLSFHWKDGNIKKERNLHCTVLPGLHWKCFERASAMIPKLPCFISLSSNPFLQLLWSDAILAWQGLESKFPLKIPYLFPFEVSLNIAKNSYVDEYWNSRVEKLSQD